MDTQRGDFGHNIIRMLIRETFNEYQSPHKIVELRAFSFELFMVFYITINN